MLRVRAHAEDDGRILAGAPTTFFLQSSTPGAHHEDHQCHPARYFAALAVPAVFLIAITRTHNAMLSSNKILLLSLYSAVSLHCCHLLHSFLLSAQLTWSRPRSFQTVAISQQCPSVASVRLMYTRVLPCTATEHLLSCALQAVVVNLVTFRQCGPVSRLSLLAKPTTYHRVT